MDKKKGGLCNDAQDLEKVDCTKCADLDFCSELAELHLKDAPPPPPPDNDFKLERDIIHGGGSIGKGVGYKTVEMMLCRRLNYIRFISNEKEKILETGAKLCHLNGCEEEGISSGQPTPDQWREAFKEMSDLVGGKRIVDQALTVKKSVKDIIDKKEDCPLPLDVIPNRMGINLCSVDAISWQRQEDGQLKDLTIHFKPTPDQKEEE